MVHPQYHCLSLSTVTYTSRSRSIAISVPSLKQCYSVSTSACFAIVSLSKPSIVLDINSNMDTDDAHSTVKLVSFILVAMVIWFISYLFYTFCKIQPLTLIYLSCLMSMLKLYRSVKKVIPSRYQLILPNYQIL